MVNEVVNQINKRNFEKAYDLAKVESTLPLIYKVWTQIYEGFKFDHIERAIDFNRFDIELIEATKLYIHLSESSWDDKLLSEFRKVTKMIIAETGAELRRQSHSQVNGEIICNNNVSINPVIREHIQNLIEHFDKKELHESKADMARIKAQLTLTMNLEKRLIGLDMIQYGKFYENVKQFDDSVQIYNGVVSDFQDVIGNSYQNEEEHIAELNILREAYEGLLRLTNNSEVGRKLGSLIEHISRLESISSKQKAKTTIGNVQHESKKAWFNKLFGD